MKQVLLLLGMSLTYADLLGGESDDTVPQTEDDESSGVVELLGGNRDEHDCLTSAGFTWCESKAECIQAFVEDCEDAETTNVDDFLNSILTPDKHIPNFEAEATSTETEDNEDDVTPVVLIGGDRDDNDCIASAGYTWCEKRSECVRSWMLDGEWDDECTVEPTVVGDDQDENDCIASAGYTWCEKQSKCVRSWELQGEWDEECTTETTSDSSSGYMSSSEGSSDSISSSSEGSSEGSSDSQAGASESTQDDLAKFFYNEDGTIKPWVFKVFLGLSITAAVLLVCLIRVRRLRKRRRRRRRRSAGVQMLSSDRDNYARFNGDESNFVFQETVAVKTSGKDDVPNRKEFTNLV